MDEKKIQALITLLDDPNEEVFRAAEQALLSEELEIIPILESAWESSEDTTYQQRLVNLIHDLQFKDLKNELRKWILNSDDLLYGAYLVSRYRYPTLKYEEINTKVTKIKTDIWLELSDNLTALEKVRIINHILFNVYGFSGNSGDILSPNNSFITDVVDTKRGNTITLSILYSVIAQRLEMPVYGVNLPKSFVLAYMDETSDLHKTDNGVEGAVLFYITPINKGLILGKKEIEIFIRQQKLDFNVSYFLPSNNREIIRRLLNNLVVAYETLKDNQRVSEIEELLMMFP